MKLYEVPKNTKIKLISEESGPIASIPPHKDTIYKFSHIDGMYSYCTDEDNNVVFLPAWSEVEILDKL